MDSPKFWVPSLEILAKSVLSAIPLGLGGGWREGVSDMPWSMQGSFKEQRIRHAILLEHLAASPELYPPCGELMLQELSTVNGESRPPLSHTEGPSGIISVSNPQTISHATEN